MLHQAGGAWGNRYVSGWSLRLTGMLMEDARRMIQDSRWKILKGRLKML